jgi:hypothetical protein
VGEVQVEDFPHPVGDEDVYVLARTLTLSAANPPGNLWLRAAAAAMIEPAGAGAYKIDGAWTLKIAGGGKPELRQKDRQELLVPVIFDGNKARVELTYDW